MNKIILDTDPGIDDAMAILFAHYHPGIEMLGMTTIFGNVATEVATENALRLCSLAGIDVPVCHGETTGVKEPPQPYPHWVHGHNGLGDIERPPLEREADPRDAVTFIAETVAAHPNEVTLVPVGPLTNIARFVERHPDLVPLVKEVVVMGGAAHVLGNVTPLADANSANDPVAADMVYGAPWKVTMVGMDVTVPSVVTTEDFAEIAQANTRTGPFLAEAAAFYIRCYTDLLDVSGCCMHDVDALALIVQPDLFEVEKARIRVVPDGIARGKTAVMPEGFFSKDEEWLARPMQAYATEVDSKRLRDLFVETLKKG